MGHEFKACAECTEKCLLVHGNKRNASPVITTFVRVMFGNQFSKYVELPPNVACAVSLADQSTFIEDSRGLRWNVAISSIDGFFAFRHGWNTFSLDHDLQLGNILVFNYIKGSHFTVKIYDNSGCELNFFETNEKKRKRDHRDSIFKGGWCYAVDKSSMSKDDSGLCGCSDAEINKRLYEANGKGKAPITKQYASNCEAEYAEEMCDMINREYGDKQGENRAHILDLYDYEMPKKIKNSGSEGSNKVAAVNVTCCHNADSSLILKNEASSVKDPVVKEVATRVIPLDGSEFERTLKNNYCEAKVKKEEPSDMHSFIETSGHLFPTLAVIPEENEETISAISTRATKKCRTADGSGGDEAISIETRLKSGHPTLVVIMQPSDLMNALKIDITFAKQYMCAQGSGCNVNLQIPNGSTWPTLCSVTEKENARIRYRGWMKFATDNRLQVGDACVLEMIKQLPHEITFLVHITRAGGDEAISIETRFKSGHPTLVVIMQPSDLMNALKIDITFAKQYMCAPGSGCNVNLQIPNGSTWPTLCSVTEKENARIRYRGWMKFATDNRLQVGDACVLEMIKQLPHEITFLVHITRARPSYIRCM